MSFKMRCLCFICTWIWIWYLHITYNNYYEINNSNQTIESSVANIELFIGWFTNIDIVIPWSGQPKGHINGTDIERERYNKELPYLLRSIANHAPWVRKVWILINNGELPPEPFTIPPTIKSLTYVLDRCTFMSNFTCPTRNSHAVSAFVHRIPKLAEHFILAEDDIFLGRPVTPSHFYEDGKPFVWRKKPTWGNFAGEEFHRIYEDPSVVSFPTPKSSAPSPHYWYPNLKSICASMEQQYPEFYAFVGSHTSGRYSSLAKGVSDEQNSQEECFYGWMNWELLRTQNGIYKNIDTKRYEWWDEVVISEAGFKKTITDKPIFLNVNDRFSTNATMYEMEIGWFHAAMEMMFPIQMTVKRNITIVGIGIPRAGSNKLDTMITESFGLVSSNTIWANLAEGTARDAIYCSHGKTIAHSAVKEDVLRRLGKECNYLGTHQDLSIAHHLDGLNISYVTMLRDPVNRLVSGCNYHLGPKCNWDTIIDFAHSNRGYGMADRMTKMIAGLDPVCSVETSDILAKYASNDALLARAKYNLRERFIFVGILERLSESFELLPSSTNLNLVFPRLDSSGGSFKGERKQLVERLGPYIQLDQELYSYANQLLDSRLKIIHPYPP